MQYLILVAWLTVNSHAYTPTCAAFSTPAEFGIFLDSSGKRVINIVACYYVKKGDARSLHAANIGAELWNQHSDKYVLIPDTSSTPYLIRFKLSVSVVDDPDSAKILQDYIQYYSFQKQTVINKLAVVKDRELDIEDAGITYGNQISNIKEFYMGDVRVCAHEIGHTLGLRDTDSGIMTRSTEGRSKVVSAADIYNIIEFARTYMSEARFFIDPSIPQGHVELINSANNTTD